jgi:aminoglycoside phosphotransferase (APT) family kinase protein
MNTGIAALVIATQCPQLAPADVRLLGEGCDSVAFEVNGEWVFRFPKGEETAAQFAIEARLLPQIAPRLPLPVPVFLFSGEPSTLFPRAFCGYRKLPGDPAIRLPSSDVPFESLAAPIAHFLTALHAVPVEAAIEAGVPRQPLRETVEELRDDALADLCRVREADAAAPVEAWRAFLDAAPDGGRARGAVLLHNDFAAEHLLFDSASGTITGVIDWSDVAIGDPAFDFGGLFHWGGDAFARAVAAACEPPLDEDALILGRYLGACRGAMDVAFGLEHARTEYVTAGLRALGLCAGR